MRRVALVGMQGAGHESESDSESVGNPTHLWENRGWFTIALLTC